MIEQMEYTPRQERLLSAESTGKLRGLHQLISCELAARGEQVSLLIAGHGPVSHDRLPWLRWEVYLRGITTFELAEMAGVGKPTTEEAIAGRNPVRNGVAVKIAEALDMSVEDLRMPPPRFIEMHRTDAAALAAESGKEGAA